MIFLLIEIKVQTNYKRKSQRLDQDLKILKLLKKSSKLLKKNLKMT